MIMPSGKYKGTDIELLPSWYLKWVAENWQEITAKDKVLCAAADKEWRYREQFGMHFNDVLKTPDAPRQAHFKF